MKKQTTISASNTKTASLDKIQEAISDLNFEETIIFLQEKVR
jgi:hypothetical protein